MSKERDKIVSLLDSLNYPAGKKTEEYTFTLEAVDIFFYKRKGDLIGKTMWAMRKKK